MCRTVCKYGAQHHANLCRYSIVKHRLRFHLVPKDDASVAVPDFLDKASLGPVGVLALEHLSGKYRLVSGADFGKRNVVHAERHTEHFLQFLVNTDFFCKACVVRHRKRTAVVRPVTQMRHVKVICVAVHRFNHCVQALKVGERKVVRKLHGIERRQVRGFVRIKLLDFAGAHDFGIMLKVVMNVFRYLRVAFRLL